MTDESQRKFEELNRELVETVEKLESGELSLEESLLLFERATALAAECNTRLDQAELRVRQVTASPQGVMAAERFTGWERE